MVGVRHLEVFSYAELLQLASSRRDENGSSLLQRFIDAVGRSGCGLLAVQGIPHLLSLRHALLRLAPLLAHLSPTERSQILKHHRLGTDVSLKDSSRSVSSFAAQINFSKAETEMDMRLHTDSVEHYCNRYSENQTDAIGELGPIFRQLGKEMSDVGLLVAKICDIMFPEAELENTILEASTAKGRLIHYHSIAENSHQQSNCHHSLGSKSRSQKPMQDWNQMQSITNSDLWQHWHFDYGVFTVLTAPMFMRSCVNAGSGSSLHNLNFIESNDSFPHIGLKILSSGSKKVEFVYARADCLLVQVGEAAEILTGGKLRATVHCVCRPSDKDDVSRETFVIFLQPAWDKCLVSPNPEGFLDADEELDDSGFEEEMLEIQYKVPSLCSRWRNGCTFAEFSQVTVKKYYGTNGAQGK